MRHAKTRVQVRFLHASASPNGLASDGATRITYRARAETGPESGSRLSKSDPRNRHLCAIWSKNDTQTAWSNQEERSRPAIH